jgi:hypothetical protein
MVLPGDTDTGITHIKLDKPVLQMVTELNPASPGEFEGIDQEVGNDLYQLDLIRPNDCLVVRKTGSYRKFNGLIIRFNWNWS